jgi:hypothetical protein
MPGKDLIEVVPDGPRRQPSTKSRRFVPGRNTFVSENYEAETSFAAECPPNSPYAAELQKIAMNVQKKQAPARKKSVRVESTGKRSSEFVRRRDSGGESLEVRRPPVEVFPPQAPGPWRRYKTENEVAYQSKGDKGKFWVSAPLGSDEAEQYEAMMEQYSKVRGQMS